MDGSYFGFNSRPFAAAPVVESYFPAQTIEQSRQTLIRIIQRAEGPGLVIGPTGVGKSLLCHLLAAYFRESFDVVMLSSIRICTRKALLQNILFELNLPYRDMEEGELRLSLLDFLQPGQSNPNGILLLVDEAHALPMRLLDEVRMITNLVRDGQPRARLVLAGSPKLDERFAHPKLESFNQRLAARCYLEPLTHDETIHYVRSQVNSAGGDPDSVFSEDALEAIYRASDGIPRLINQVCDHALLMASAGGRSQLDAAGIDEAWADLQQLPAPWYDHDAQSTSDSVVEFGRLDEVSSQATPDAEDDQLAIVTTPIVELSRADDLPIAVLDTGWQEALPEIRLVDEPADFAPDTDAQSDFQPQVVHDESNHYEQETADPAQMSPAESLHIDPFAGTFEEEELVIDRYASLEIEAFRGRPQVIGDESLEIASALGQTEAAKLTISLPEETEVDESVTEGDSNVPSEETDDTTIDQPWEVASEIQVSPLFQYTVLETAPCQELAVEMTDTLQTAILPGNETAPEPDAEFCCVEFAQVQDLADDDRDLMIVENDDHERGEIEEPALPGPSQSAEYQQLFSQLRKV